MAQGLLDRRSADPLASDEILDRWVQGYAGVLRPRLMLGRYRVPDADPFAVERRIEAALGDGAGWAFGGSAAAFRVTGGEWNTFDTPVTNTAVSGAPVGLFALGIFQDAPIYASFQSFDITGDAVPGAPEVQGFADPVWVDPSGNGVGSATFVPDDGSRTATLELPIAQFGKVGSGWTFTGRPGSRRSRTAARLCCPRPRRCWCAIGCPAARCSPTSARTG